LGNQNKVFKGIKMSKIVNYTPHTISVLDKSTGNTTSYPSSGVARVSCVPTLVDSIGGIPVSSQEFGEITGLPEFEVGTYVVVSGMVLAALKGSRIDVVGPDTGPTAVRENGQVVAVTGFVR
jgi:hypothetical protein